MTARRLITLVTLFAPLLLAPSASAGVAWYEGDVERALALSAKDDTATLVYFTATWCPSCQDLEAEVLGAPAGATATAELRAVKVDVDAPGGAELVKRFVILGYPTAVLLAPSSEELGRVAGFEGKAAWTEALRALKAVKDPLGVLRAKAAKAPGKAAPSLALGRALLERGQRAEGEALLQLVTVRWPTSDASAEALWCLGRYYHRVRQEPMTAQHIWRELGERHARASWAGGAWWWYAKAQVALGRADLGAAALEAVAKRDASAVRPVQSLVAFVLKHDLKARYAGAQALIAAALRHRRSAEERATLRGLEAKIEGALGGDH